MTNGRRLVRAASVALSGVGLALAAARVVGSRLEPVFFIPVGAAVLVGFLFARLRIEFRLVGYVFVFAATTYAVAAATKATAADVAHGLLDGPRQVITTGWPSPPLATIFIALAACVYLVVAIGNDLAMRSHWRALAIVPLISGMVAMLAVSAPIGAQWAPAVCTATAAFLLLWIGLDDRVVSVRAGSVVAAAVGLTVLAAAVGVTISGRADPRRTEAANRQLVLLDPLAEVAAQRRASPSDRYVVSSNDLGRLHRWRTAVLDVYNGESWSAVGRLTPIGNTLAAGRPGDRYSVKITAQSNTTLWPVPGVALRTASSVETDTERRVLRIVGTRRPVTNSFVFQPVADFDPATAETLATTQPTDIESSYRSFADSKAGSGTVAQQVGNLVSELLDNYAFDSTRPGGVQQGLIDQFLRTDKVGNREQFVTGFVLLARSLGVDARVAVGYEFDPGEATTATITTRQANAWAEIHVGGVWAAVNVVPPDSRSPVSNSGQAPASQTPPVAQSPNLPKVEPPTVIEPTVPPSTSATIGAWQSVRIWALRAALYVGLLLWPVVVYAAVVWWKKRRRRKGLTSADPAQRVATAWVLATDALVDAGAALRRSQTNAQLVEAGAAAQPKAASPLGRLQRHADAVMFTTQACEAGRADDAIEQLNLIEENIRNSSSRWWRWKWWLSTRSLRRRTQSPLR